MNRVPHRAAREHLFTTGYRSARAGWLAIALAMLCATATRADEPRPLPAGPGVVLIVASNLPPTVAPALADLRACLDRAGAVIRQGTEDEGDTPGRLRVWVGLQPALAPRFPGMEWQCDRPESFAIALRGQDIALVGHDGGTNSPPREDGTVNAIYEFLERFLGVRWFFPGELGWHVPHRDAWAWPDQVFRYTPPLQGRNLRIISHVKSLGTNPTPPSATLATARRMDAETTDWARRQRLGGSFSMRAGHAFTTWHARFADKEPDLFALQPDGTRTPYPKAERVKLCVSNPDTARRWLDEVDAELKRSPASRMFSASDNDSAYSGFCVCDRCRTWDVPDAPAVQLKWRNHETNHPALTDRHVHFWNLLAEGLRQRHPDRSFDIGVWAYGAMRTPPLREKPDASLIIGFVGNLAGGAARTRASETDLWQRWSALCKRLVWRPNLFHNSWGMPATPTGQLGASFRFMAEHGLMAIDVDSLYQHWATQGLNYYLLAKLAWDPQADVERLAADYVSAMVGPAAAPHVGAYLAELEALGAAVEESSAGASRFGVVDAYRQGVDATAIARLRRHLDRAEKAIVGHGDAAQCGRLAFLRSGLDFLDAQRTAMEAMSAIRRGKGSSAAMLHADAVSRRRDELGKAAWPTYAVGWPQLTQYMQRKGMQSYLGPPTAEDLAAAVDPAVIALPGEWPFRFDPDDRGIAEQWFATDAADTNWMPVSVWQAWPSPATGAVDLDDPVDRNYTGLAWYRLAFNAPDLKAGERLCVEFGQVDEGCWIYLNGTLVASAPFDPARDPDAWKKRRRFDLTKALQPGRNVIAVRVESKSGQGGIMGGACLRRTSK